MTGCFDPSLLIAQQVRLPLESAIGIKDASEQSSIAVPLEALNLNPGVSRRTRLKLKWKASWGCVVRLPIAHEPNRRRAFIGDLYDRVVLVRDLDFRKDQKASILHPG
jgi:hypothetical protein